MAELVICPLDEVEFINKKGFLMCLDTIEEFDAEGAAEQWLANYYSDLDYPSHMYFMVWDEDGCGHVVFVDVVAIPQFNGSEVELIERDIAVDQ